MTPRPRTPSATDLTVALGVGALTLGALIIAPLLLGPGETAIIDGATWSALVAVLAFDIVLLCFARIAPRIALVGTSAAAMLLGVLVPTGFGSLAGTAVIVAVVRAALVLPPRGLRLLLPVAGVLVAVGQAADIVGSSAIPPLAAAGAGVLQAVAIVGLPSVGVLAVAARRDARLARIGESAAVEREQTALVQAALAQERTSMARELHDIAAHHVSSIALMAAAIEQQVDTDPAAAKQAVRQVRNQSRTLLDDLRRLVGLLRGDDDDDAVKTLATLPALIAEVQAAGRTVELRVLGDDGEVGPLGQLVVYRMVQESLTNAARHAPGTSCTVELDRTWAGRITVTVRNTAAERPPIGRHDGLGLIGMRERASLVGGTVTAGPDDDGGWTVQLTLPAERPLRRGGAA